jgi:predicted membrane-bound mannosyltransferase
VVSALAMVFAPAFVVHSRFMTVDVPTTFFVALAFHQAVALACVAASDAHAAVGRVLGRVRGWR